MKLVVTTAQFVSIQLMLFFPTLLRAEPLKIGIVAPLTGPVAPFGVALKNGIELAQIDDQDTESAVVQYIFEDSAYSGKATISSINKLTRSDALDLLFVWGTTPAIAAAPVAERNKIPMFALSGEEAVAANKEYVIDFTGRISDFSAATIEHARAKGLKNTAVVKIETQYIETLLRGMEEHKVAGEKFDVVASLTPDEVPDFNTIATRLQQLIRAKHIDSLALLLGAGQIHLFYQKLQQLKISIPSYGSDYFGDPDEMRKAGQIAQGSFFATIKTSDAFVKRYGEHFKNTTAVSYAANVYDFARLTHQLFKATSKKMSAREVLERFENAPRTDGATGIFYFVKEDSSKYQNPGKRFVFPIVIKEVQADGSSKEVAVWKENS
jgi:ABC-type branched-subunit amino acid transport system substrate-binding protein